MNVIILLRGFSPAEPRSKSSLPMRHAPKESEKTRRKIPIDEGNGGEKERTVGVAEGWVNVGVQAGQCADKLARSNWPRQNYFLGLKSHSVGVDAEVLG